MPGLVLARAQPTSHWVLVDASVRRTAFLVRAVRALGMDQRVEVVTGRAEDLGRQAEHRQGYQVVVARSFGRPAVVAECAAPLLVTGGTLVVSEPPEAERRWPEEALGVLGLGVVTTTRTAPRLVLLRQEGACPERFPRRVGVPAKRPLW